VEYIIETHNLTKEFKRLGETPLSEYMWVTRIKEVLLSKLSRRIPETFFAVDHVNLRVRRGELFGLVGPNGAGKTTLIKLLSGILKPDEGTATINGYDILREIKQAQRQVCLLPAGGWIGFNWALSVKENLEFFAILHGIQKEEASDRIDETLSAVGLTDRADDSIMDLSSGMRQRMALANGLLMQKPIFFMDEPTIGIDPRGAREIREYIQRLNRELEQTMFLTTHYMREAEMLCDRVAIMDLGKIIACDSPNNLKKKIAVHSILEIHGYNLSSEIATDLKQIEAVENAVCTIHDHALGSGTLRIYTDDTEKSLPKVIHTLEKRGTHIRSIQEDKPTLEDVFIKLCGKSLAS